MPPKRKKSVRQKQRQSQRQSVVVNIGKTTTRRRKKTGRGGLPPPSHQQNLFPPTIIQQQANLGGLENEITRLTSLIQARQPINNLVTPLSSSVAQDPATPGIKAEERRAGPTASNFQQMPSKADFGFPDALSGGISDISTLTGPSLQVGFNEDESVSDPSERFEAEIQKQKKENDFGGSSLPPTNTIKQDDTGVKKSPFTKKTTIAEEIDLFKITRDASDAEELQAERQKSFNSAMKRLPQTSIAEGHPDFSQKIFTKIQTKLGKSFFNQVLEENRKLLAPKPKKAKPRADSSDSD